MNLAKPLSYDTRIDGRDVIITLQPAATDTATAPVIAQPDAKNSIEAINVAGQQGGAIIIRITLRQPPANPPAGFTINNPPRIAFDFPDTGNALGKNTQEVGDGDLRNMNIVQAGDRTRLVMNLAKPLSYDTRIDGRDVIITLQPAATDTAAAPALISRFAQAKPGDARHSLRDVGFRRGPNGEGRIIVDLSDKALGIDLRQEGKSLIIDFLNTALPKNLERRLDVVDFATPVQIIETFAQGGNSRIAIQPKGLWEYSAYQTDNRFIVEVKAIVEDPNKLIQGSRPGYSGEKLSLNFQNVEVRAVLQVIADFTGFNFVTSDTVSGNLTLRLKDVPWDQALDIILQAKDLGMRKSGNVVRIAPREELAIKEKLALEAQSQISELEPLRTETFQLNYHKALEIQQLLSPPATAQGRGRILTRRGSVSGDPRTNTVFVQDTPSSLDEVRALLRKLDAPVRQVMIEARIVEASDNFSRNLGVRLGVLERDVLDRRRVTVGGSLEATAKTTTLVTGTPTLSETLGVNLPAAALSGATPGVFSLILFREGLTRFLNMELSALQADKKGKIISSPRVITADQTEATIEQGTEIPFTTTAAAGATPTVSFKKATLSLKVKPQITPDENIIMRLEVRKDSKGDVIAGNVSINTKAITTEVLVQNGGTVVIGGIYTQDESDTTTKIPVLGDIPYVGFLFRQNTKFDDKTELLIFVTPRIIKGSLSLR
jgi:type IV pilus assembly protein PilQ